MSERTKESDASEVIAVDQTRGAGRAMRWTRAVEIGEGRLADARRQRRVESGRLDVKISGNSRPSGARRRLQLRDLWARNQTGH